LQHKLLQRTLDELDRARQWMMLLGRKTASERIATLLLEISNRLGSSNCSAISPFLDEFDLPMDRQQMGDVLGLTIETVSRQLTKLKDADMIALPDRRRVVIKDRRRLEHLADAA
jgi:CRP/FNR family transcriptional regulator